MLPCCLPGTGRRKESYNVGVPTSVCRQLHNTFVNSTKRLHKVTEINKALGMSRIKIIISNNSTLSLNSESRIIIFGS